MLSFSEYERQWARTQRRYKGASVRRQEKEAARLQILASLRDQPGGMDAINGMAKQEAREAMMSSIARRALERDRKASDASLGG
jgi:hypothetical protein